MPVTACLARALVAAGALAQAVATPEGAPAGCVGQDDTAMLQLGAFGGAGRAAATLAAQHASDEAGAAAGEGGAGKVGATCGGPGSYPRLNGTQYNWTSFQLEWMPGMLPTWGFFHSAYETPQFLMQRSASGRPSLDGPFVVLRIDDPLVGVSEALCAWDTQESLTCLITDGRLFGRFVVSAGLTGDCVPLKLAMPASYSAPASGYSVAVRGGEMVLASTQASGTVFQEGAAGARDVAADDNGSSPCAGYFPALAGSNYSLTSYRLTHSPGQAANASTFQMDSSWTFNFFNYIYAMGGAVNWHNQYVQLAINAGQRYLLCVFANQTSTAPLTAYSLLCTDHPDGRFVVQLTIQLADVNATTCVPSRLSLTAAFGSLPVPLDATNANGTTSEREVVSWGGYLDLVGNPAKEQAAPGGSRYPSVANMWYRWLSSEFTNFDNQTANLSTVVQRRVAAHFFRQVGADGQPNPFGQSVQVNVRGDLYSYYAICTWQDQLTLTCVDTLQGLLVHRFQVQESSLDPVSRVPSRLRAFRYGSLPVPGTAVATGKPVQQVLLAMGEPALS